MGRDFEDIGPVLAGDPSAKRLLLRMRNEIQKRTRIGVSSTAYIREATARLLRLRGSAHADVRMECMLDCARHLYFIGSPRESIDCLRQIEELAKQTRSKKWQRTVNNCYGIILGDCGDVAGAVSRYQVALGLARELRDLDNEARVLMNLGVALLYGGLYREAVPCFQRSIDLFATNASEPDLTNGAITNLAQCLMHLGEIDLAFSTIQLALSNSQPPKDINLAGSRVIREFTFVQIALELGAVKDAKIHALLAADFARGCAERFQDLAAISLASCLVLENQYEAGISALENILRRSDVFSTRETVLIALFKAHERADQPEHALETLQALLAHVREFRSKGLDALRSNMCAFTEIGIASEEHDLASFQHREAQLRARVAERKALSSQIEMLERLAITADVRDEISGEHGARVGRLSALLARQLNWSKDAIHAIELGAKLHDIGKIGVPDRILLNTRDLAAVERHFVSAHTQIGAELLGKSQFPHVKIAEEIARYHHECWDGEGYPSRLAGERIPLHARIVALADVFDALTHGRPYSPPWPFERAVDEIEQRKGRQFDPALTDVFVKMVRELHATHPNLDAFLLQGQKDTPFAQARRRITAMLEAERHGAEKASAHALPEPSAIH